MTRALAMIEILKEPVVRAIMSTCFTDVKPRPVRIARCHRVIIKPVGRSVRWLAGRLFARSLARSLARSFVSIARSRKANR